VVGERGTRTVKEYETEGEAKQVIRSLKRHLVRESSETIGQARDKYEIYMREEKQNKRDSITATICRLEAFFPEAEEPLVDLTPKRCQDLYDAVCLRKSERTKKVLSVDTQRNALAEAKTFLTWCVGKGWLPTNPLLLVEGKGRRQNGKLQLRINEARRWLDSAERLADEGEVGAVAAMVALLMGLRASEIVQRVVRDLDDDGRLLWIPDSKTKAGRRTQEVPEVLQPYVMRLVEGRGPEELLFGAHWRDWPRTWVKRICKAASVPTVTAHGMRGLHSTIAKDRGMSAHAVATALGHESARTTMRSYIAPGTVANSDQRRVVSVLGRGAKGTSRMRNDSSPIVPTPQGDEKKSSDSVELMGIEPTASRVRFFA
jgi:integrase